MPRLLKRAAIPLAPIAAYFALKPTLTGHAVGEEGCGGPLEETTDEEIETGGVEIDPVMTDEEALTVACVPSQVFDDLSPSLALNFEQDTIFGKRSVVMWHLTSPGNGS